MAEACDVLIVGCGVSGVTAAVAAAREGAHTLVCEPNAFPGGAAVTALHRVICGLYRNTAERPVDLLNEGLVREVCSRLQALAPSTAPARMGRVWVLPYSAAPLGAVLQALLEAEPNLTKRFGAQVTAVRAADGRVAEVDIEQAGTRSTVTPRVVVDCSGDGVALQALPGACEDSPAAERQLAGFTMRVEGLQEAGPMLPIQVPHCLAKAALAGLILPHLRFTTFVRGDAPDEGYCKLSLPPLSSAAEAERDCTCVLDCLSEDIPAFRKALVAETSLAVMEREGVRLLGEYTLTEEDVLHGRKFPDGCARSAWPIELWDQRRGPTYRYLTEGEYYEIPRRCLRSSAYTNLLAAGRCISASRAALGSTRVMGTCLALGEAAGRLAAHEAVS